MYKKVSVFALILVVLSFPNFAEAATVNYEYFGTANGTASGFLNLNTNNFDPDEHFTDVTVVGEGTGRVEFYTVGSNGAIDSSNPIASGSVPGTVSGARGAQWFKIFSEDGKELHATIAHSTAPHAETIIFGDGGYSDGSDSGGDSGGGSDGGNQTCTISNPCAVFECPEWDTYMSKINQIASSIPEMPNWSVVAGTFADEIAPRIKSDMASLFNNTMAPRLKSDMTEVLNDTLGKAPSLPSAPDMPQLGENIDLSPPEGEEAEGLGDSTFSKDDLKSEAEEIEVRDDPTGGFDINNPLTDLDPPDLTPIEPENNAPVPSNPEGSAPMPVDELPAPPTPTEEAKTPPVPSEIPSSPPMPNEQQESPPIPSGGGWEAPIPSDNGGSIPIPSDGNMSVPIPSN
jgi:hypothetical protein